MEDIGLVKVDALFHQGFVHGFQIKQVQLVDTIFIPGNIQVVQHRGGLSLGEGHRKAHVRLLQPALGRKPGIGAFLLLVVLEILLEQAEMIAKPHAVPRQAQSGGGVQIAGSQAAQTAVAQGGLIFLFFHLGQVFTSLGQGLFHLVVDPQIDQVVGQQFAHQEFRGDVVQLFLPLDLLGRCQLFLDKFQQGQVDLLVVRCHQAFGKTQAHLLFQFITHPHGCFLLTPGRGRKWWPAGPFSWQVFWWCSLLPSATASWSPPRWKGC